MKAIPQWNAAKLAINPRELRGSLDPMKWVLEIEANKLNNRMFQIRRYNLWKFQICSDSTFVTYAVVLNRNLWSVLAVNDLNEYPRNGDFRSSSSLVSDGVDDWCLVFNEPNCFDNSLRQGLGMFWKGFSKYLVVCKCIYIDLVMLTDL